MIWWARMYPQVAVGEADRLERERAAGAQESLDAGVEKRLPEAR